MAVPAKRIELAKANGSAGAGVEAGAGPSSAKRAITGSEGAGDGAGSTID
ncbi:hypothetical protein [Streptomyces alkaliphilus]|nr:hypothetical protein [Streptomyces alkaliphilus]